MKRLNLTTLQHKAFVLISLFVLLSLVEWFIIKNQNYKLFHSEAQLELAQNSSLTVLKLATEVNNLLQGEKEKAPEMMNLVSELDANLKIFGEGGRPEGTNIELKPVSRLTKITLTRILEKWTDYKNNLTIVTTRELWKDTVIAAAPIEPAEVDSTATLNEEIQIQTQKIIDPAAAKARLIVESGLRGIMSQMAVLAKDLKEDKEQNEFQSSLVVTLVLIFNILIITLFFILFKRKILKPLSDIEHATVTGSAVNKISDDEIGKVALGLNEILNQLNRASAFVQNIGDGKLDVAYGNEDDHSLKNDKLASSLISMQEKLKSMNEEERKRKWANEGLAKFVDIVRTSDDNLHALGDKIISSLVQYTGSNQGGLYILNDEDNKDQHLELVSLYAFNIKKYQQQKLRIGEGLVGQAYLEKDTILLKEIPDDYIRITSGLGDANPKNILVVPLKVDKEVYGLVELASFSEYQPHEITFVEKIGETLASTLASVRTNQRNRKLLEDSRTAAEMMRAQEEEMRQNMEELTSTQEEMSRKERDYVLKIKALENELANTSKRENWDRIEELEGQLQIHLEALKITQKTLSK